ncbi:uncharacterized protein Dvir_GJ11990 [Drosophila virilis]|uniref:RING-type domain-containing protein n=1 Tax=Drosophila virilis TaxID=7244 RepID=B4LIA0_DROVI|nr:E3 ubiquitin-protein ligase rnf8-B [Drosophila virilis]EDW69667.1 uncharacterized protein Dvir_GJ11990 [Drosophila virilis]
MALSNGEEEFLSIQEKIIEEELVSETVQKTDELDPYKIILKNTNELQKQLSELCAKVEDLQFQNQPVLIQNQEQLQSLQNYCREMDEHVASIKTIQDLQSQEFNQKLLEKDQMRLQLLADLKRQEESHIQEMDQLKLKLKTELEEKDRQCLELEQEIERCKTHNDISVSCSICLDPWNSSSDHRLVSLQCGHLFGDKCIRSCLKQLNECPQCRAPSRTDYIRYLYGRPL